MQTLKAMALIARAVELSEADFHGDALLEACRLASPDERQAVQCIVQSRAALIDHQPASAAEVMAALRAMVRGQCSPALANRHMHWAD
jgi:hypothetical protein